MGTGKGMESGGWAKVYLGVKGREEMTGEMYRYKWELNHFSYNSCWGSSLIVFMVFLNIYLLFIERASERQRQRSCMNWFILQIAAVTRVGSDWIPPSGCR